MTTVAPGRPRSTAGRTPARPCKPPRNERHGWGGRWLILAAGVLLAGYLLFCHGCHGDEDNELFASGAVAPLCR